MIAGRSWQAVVVVVAVVDVGSVWATCSVAAAGERFQAAPMLTRAETVKRVKEDLARYLKVTSSRVELVAESDEVWRDATLGCSARKPLDEPVVTPGFAFTLSYRGRSYVYHTDRRGLLRRCDAAAKPVAPISR